MTSIKQDAFKEDERVRNLQLEVLRLETKLKDLHATDTVANRRALATLQQHVAALYQDNQGIKENLSGIEVDLLGQKVLEEELTALSATTLATYIGDRVLKASRMLESRELRGALWVLSGTFVAWRLTVGLWRKTKRRIQRSKECKAVVEAQYERVAGRIEVMRQLVPHVESPGAL